MTRSKYWLSILISLLTIFLITIVLWVFTPITEAELDALLSDPIITAMWLAFVIWLGAKRGQDIGWAWWSGGLVIFLPLMWIVMGCLGSNTDVAYTRRKKNIT